MAEMTSRVAEEQRILVLDIALRGTLARWWATHKVYLPT